MIFELTGQHVAIPWPTTVADNGTPSGRGLPIGPFACGNGLRLDVGRAQSRAFAFDDTTRGVMIPLAARLNSPQVRKVAILRKEITLLPIRPGADSKSWHHAVLKGPGSAAQAALRYKERSNRPKGRTNP